MLHLKKLSNAGLTHVHLLPTFQFAGVDDEKENWKCVGKIVFHLLILKHFPIPFLPPPKKKKLYYGDEQML